jgi:hypothetical protein
VEHLPSEQELAELEQLVAMVELRSSKAELPLQQDQESEARLVLWVALVELQVLADLSFLTLQL